VAISIDNLINVAFRKGEDLSRFGLKVGGKGDYRPPQFDAESLKFEYIDTNGSYGIDLNGSRFLQKLTFAESQTFTRATTGTFVGSNGLIQTAAIDAPRFTHDPVTREVQGLLIEEARTNKLTHSQTFDTGDWGTSGASVVAVTEGLSFNGSDGFKLTEDNSYGSHLLYQPQTYYTGENSYWIVVEPAERTNIRILAKDDNGRHYVDFDLENLIVTKESEAEGKIFKANGLVYCELQFTTISSSVFQFGFYIRLIDEVTNANYQGDGSSGVIIYASQGEEGSFATSYIPTTSAQVTRAADSCERVLGDEFNPDEGSVYWEGEVLGFSRFSGLFSIGTDSDNRLVDINTHGNTGAVQFSTRLNGVYIVANDNLISSPVGVNRVCVSYSKDRIIGYANGVKMTDVSNFGGVLPPATVLGVGKRPWAAAYASSKTEAAAYIPKFLSDAELITLTGGN
jgi:hypothetical protein